MLLKGQAERQVSEEPSCAASAKCQIQTEQSSTSPLKQSIIKVEVAIPVNASQAKAVLVPKSALQNGPLLSHINTTCDGMLTAVLQHASCEGLSEAGY